MIETNKLKDIIDKNTFIWCINRQNEVVKVGTRMISQIYYLHFIYTFDGNKYLWNNIFDNLRDAETFLEHNAEI